MHPRMQQLHPAPASRLRSCAAIIVAPQNACCVGVDVDVDVNANCA